MLIPHDCRIDPPIFCGMCVHNRDAKGVANVDWHPLNVVDPRVSPPAVTVQLQPVGPCRYRSEDPASAADIARAGFNPARTHWTCDHPRLALGLVTECSTCRGAEVKRAPKCGPQCSGFSSISHVLSDTSTSL